MSTDTTRDAAIIGPVRRADELGCIHPDTLTRLNGNSTGHSANSFEPDVNGRQS